MASLVQISEEDPWLASAQFVGSILDSLEEGEEAAKGDSETFVQNVQQAYGNEDLSLVLDLFVSKLNCVFEHTENEQDLEGFTNIMCHIVPRIEPPGSPTAAERLAGALSSDPQTKPERRLQGLINLYNTVLEPSAKLHILMTSLDFAKQSGLADIMLGVVKANIDSWVPVLSLTNTDARALYVACADSLASCTRKPKTAAREAYRLRIKALNTYSVDDSEQGLEVAARVVSEFIASADLFHFDLINAPVITCLESSKQYADVYKMLHLLLSGTVKEFRGFVSTPAGKAVMTSCNTTEDALTSKMLLLALIGLFNRRASVSFKEISENLDVPIKDVENLIVQAIGKKLIEAKIDQLDETVLISKCSSRQFENVEWQNLQKDLKEWRQAIAGVLSLGVDTNTTLLQGFAKLEPYSLVDNSQ